MNLDLPFHIGNAVFSSSSVIERVVVEEESLNYD
jgi:hypothetical protein